MNLKARIARQPGRLRRLQARVEAGVNVRQSPSHRGTVVGVSGDFVLIDYGAKSEGMIPAADLRDREGQLTVKLGDSFDVSIIGFDNEGMATLSRTTGPRPRDWDGLTRAFENKEIVAGRVTGMVKGGFTVDVGSRAFLPASRSGIRDAAEMEKLVGQEIRCRITKLDIDDENVVVDRRSVMEEEAGQLRQNTLATLVEGAVVRGTVRSLATYGAFIDIGGVDGLLHVGDISWSRVTDPAAELAVGDVLDLKVLKVDKQAGKISLGLKQMSAGSMDRSGGETDSRRSRDGRSDAADGFRCVCRDSSRSGRDDPHLGNVVDQTHPPSG